MNMKILSGKRGDIGEENLIFLEYDYEK